MFECALEFMEDFARLIPTGIVLILVLNLISDLVFGGGK